MGDTKYRDLIERVAGARSCIDLFDVQLEQVATELKKHVQQQVQKQDQQRQPERNCDPSRVPLLRKIKAQLAAAGRDWRYVDAIAIRRFGKERVEWCDQKELSKLVAMLSYDAIRHGRKK